MAAEKGTTRGRRSQAKAKLVRPRPIDGHVGGRVKLRRMMLGLSQQTLARSLRVSYQQMQKNERGTNRIASSRLFELSLALDVPIQFFFDEMPAEMAATAGGPSTGFARADAADARDPLAKRETLELVRAYYRIESPSVRKRVYGLAKTLAGEMD